MKASRPHMPGYGILEANSGTGLLPWSWAEGRLAIAHNYFVATTRPGGRPHVMPVWAVWQEEKLYFSTGANSVKVRNLSANGHCVVCPESAGEAVILEGVAREETDPGVIKRFIAAYKQKYDWEMDAGQGGIYCVRPRAVFAFRELDDFEGSATRWIFDETS